MSRAAVVQQLAGLAALISCVTPSDQSADFGVMIDSIPGLFAGDAVQAVARVVDRSGSVVPGSAIVFEADNPTVASVTPTGHIVVVGYGRLNVRAWAPGLENADTGRMSTIVHDAIELDSVLPRRVKYGSLLHVYGVGLDPTGAAAVSIGGIAAPVDTFTATDMAHPERYGVLGVVVVPPLGENSDGVTAIDVRIVVSNTRGTKTSTTSLIIDPKDIYEANESVPKDLGVISERFEALGLAFDKLDPSVPGLPVDWYGFTTLNQGDWTITLRSMDAWRADASADFIRGTPTYREEFDVGINRPIALWYIDDPSLPTAGMNGACGGFVGAQFPQSAAHLEYGPHLKSGVGTRWSPTWPQVRWVLEDLPAGPHSLLIGGYYGGLRGVEAGTALYTDIAHRSYPPIRYDLIIEPGRHTARPPDRFEGNDFCEDAPTLISLGGAGFVDTVVDNLTIDAEMDYDWFVVDAQTPGRFYLTVQSEDQERKPQPLLLSPCPGVGQPVAVMYFESYSSGEEGQQLMSARDGDLGVELEARSYYLVIQPGNPRSYRLEMTWMPDTPPSTSAVCPP